MTRRLPVAPVVLWLMLGARQAARAQDSTHSFTSGVHAIGLVTHSTATPNGGALTAAYLTQPIASAEWHNRWLHATGILNLEGLTMRHGELELGAWGEGFVDRRHPHAYVHELMLGSELQRGELRGSLYAGRGFVPFGSDDPMTRPVVSYPVDHHLAQILERLVLVAALRRGPLTIEAATFNGDEPLDPPTPPLLRRFGDSWAVRGTLASTSLLTALGAELAASYANVKSPEYREGFGMDQRKAHGSVRFAGGSESVTRYALIEIARTTDVDRGRSLYTFDTLLGEAAACRGDLGAALRLERSDRPEEERLLDLFRSARPATDLSILGVTRWTTATAALSLPGASTYGAHAAPFVDIARIFVGQSTAASFNPRQFYGTNAMWRVSGGFRVGLGDEHARMGRYGAAFSDISATHSEMHHSVSPHRCFS